MKTFNLNIVKILAVLFFVLFAGAHAYSNDKGNNIPGNENKQNITPASNMETSPVKASSKKVSVTVKNIWHNMPSYDRYGNEITPMARHNMEQNETLNRKNK